MGGSDGGSGLGLTGFSVGACEGGSGFGSAGFSAGGRDEGLGAAGFLAGGRDGELPFCFWGAGRPRFGVITGEVGEGQSFLFLFGVEAGGWAVSCSRTLYRVPKPKSISSDVFRVLLSWPLLGEISSDRLAGRFLGFLGVCQSFSFVGRAAFGFWMVTAGGCAVVAFDLLADCTLFSLSLCVFWSNTCFWAICSTSLNSDSLNLRLKFFLAHCLAVSKWEIMSVFVSMHPVSSPCWNSIILS